LGQPGPSIKLEYSNWGKEGSGGGKAQNAAFFGVRNIRPGMLWGGVRNKEKGENLKQQPGKARQIRKDREYKSKGGK